MSRQIEPIRKGCDRYYERTMALPTNADLAEFLNDLGNSHRLIAIELVTAIKMAYLDGVGEGLARQGISGRTALADHGAERENDLDGG